MVRPNTDDEPLEAWLAGRLPEHERHALEKSLDAPQQPAETPPALVGLNDHRPALPADLTALIESLKTRSPESPSTPENPDAWRDLLTPDPDPAVLGCLGHYQVLAPVATGGMGVVLKARDPELKRTVAIKVLSPDLATNRTACQRFLREARAAAKLEHKNILPVYGVHEAAGVPYFAMRFAAGGSLQDRLEHGDQFTTDQLKIIALGTANALATAHANGIVHRDIKPANILFDDDALGQLWVCDFGIASSTDDPSLTYHGTIAGTPLYMSPEQADGLTADPRSDLFSLGSVLFHTATGHPPFPGDTTSAVLNRVSAADPDLARLDNTVPWLANLITALLAKNPADRPADATAVATAVTRECAPRPRRPARRLKTAIATLVALTLAALATSQLPATQRAVNAHLGRDLPHSFSLSGHYGIHPSLAEAITVARDGDTIEIRSSGPVPIANLRIPHGKRLTLTPAPGTGRATLATARPGALGLSAADHLQLVDIDFQLQTTTAMNPMLHLPAGASLVRCQFHSTGDIMHGPFYSNPCAIQLDGGTLDARDTTFAPSIAVPVRTRSGSPTVRLVRCVASASYVVHVPKRTTTRSLTLEADSCDFAATNLYRQDTPQPIPVNVTIRGSRLSMVTRFAWIASTDPQASGEQFSWTGSGNTFPLGGARARFSAQANNTATDFEKSLTLAPPRIRIAATGGEFSDLATALAAAPDGATLTLEGDISCGAGVSTPAGKTLTLQAAPGARPTVTAVHANNRALVFNGPVTLSGIRFVRFPAADHALPVVSIAPGAHTCLVEDCSFIATASSAVNPGQRALGINSPTATLRRCHFRALGGHALLAGPDNREIHIDQCAVIAATAIEIQNGDRAAPPRNISVSNSVVVANDALTTTGQTSQTTRVDVSSSLLQLAATAPEHLAPHVDWRPANDVVGGTPFDLSGYPGYLVTTDTLLQTLDPGIDSPAVATLRHISSHQHPSAHSADPSP